MIRMRKKGGRLEVAINPIKTCRMKRFFFSKHIKYIFYSSIQSWVSSLLNALTNEWKISLFSTVAHFFIIPLDHYYHLGIPVVIGRPTCASSTQNVCIESLNDLVLFPNTFPSLLGLKPSCPQAQANTIVTVSRHFFFIDF